MLMQALLSTSLRVMKLSEPEMKVLRAEKVVLKGVVQISSVRRRPGEVRACLHMLCNIRSEGLVSLSILPGWHPARCWG